MSTNIDSYLNQIKEDERRRVYAENSRDPKSTIEQISMTTGEKPETVKEHLKEKILNFLAIEVYNPAATNEHTTLKSISKVSSAIFVIENEVKAIINELIDEKKISKIWKYW